MQIHEIIRTRRTALGLTQEQLAGKLGVSAPAVNKWERGNSYPDITLLPVLARTLRVDLNTLLSFQEGLTEMEIAQFLNRLYEVSRTGGGRRGLFPGRGEAAPVPQQRRSGVQRGGAAGGPSDPVPRHR